MIVIIFFSVFFSHGSCCYCSMHSELDTSTCELELVSSLSGQVQTLTTTKTTITLLTVFILYI